MRKAELRAAYKAKRAALSADEVLGWSQQIAGQFFADARITARLAKPHAIVHTYVSIRRHNEVDTWPLVHQLWRDFPQVLTWSSITNTTNGTLHHFELTADTTFIETKWGILKPSGTFKRVVGQPDLVIVPLLAFDRQGNRVGYGGGYYDRFLGETDPDCLKIGLSFFEPLDHISGVEQTDVKLDGCISPEKQWWF